jgi:hypothetical protein
VLVRIAGGGGITVGKFPLGTQGSQPVLVLHIPAFGSGSVAVRKVCGRQLALEEAQAGAPVLRATWPVVSVVKLLAFTEGVQQRFCLFYPTLDRGVPCLTDQSKGDKVICSASGGQLVG